MHLTAIILLAFLIAIAEAVPPLTPEFVIEVHNVYQAIEQTAKNDDLLPPNYQPKPAPSLPPPVKIPAFQQAKELEVFLKTQKDPLTLIGTTPLLLHPLFKPEFLRLAQSNQARSGEQRVLLKLRELIITGETTDFFYACSLAGDSWTHYLLAQADAPIVGKTLKKGPYFFMQVITSAYSHHLPQVLATWIKSLSTENPTDVAYLLAIASVHPEFEPSILKKFSLNDPLFALASPDPEKYIPAAKILTTNHPALCFTLIQKAPPHLEEIRVAILNSLPLEALKEMNLPATIAAFARRAEADDTPARIQKFIRATEVGMNTKATLKAILESPDAQTIINGFPLTTLHFGALLQDTTGVDNLEIFKEPLQKLAGRKDWEALAILLLASRNTSLQETVTPLLSALYSPEVTSKILRIRQGKILAVAEEARQGDSSALEAIRVITQDPQVPMRQAAYDALGTLANVNDPAREILLGMAKDKNPLVRQMCVIALGSKALRKRELLEVLLRGAKDSEVIVRQAAANSLVPSGMRGSEEATLALAALAKDRHPDVRAAARRGLYNASTGGNTLAAELFDKIEQQQ